MQRLSIDEAAFVGHVAPITIRRLIDAGILKPDKKPQGNKGKNFRYHIDPDQLRQVATIQFDDTRLIMLQQKSNPDQTLLIPDESDAIRELRKRVEILEAVVFAERPRRPRAALTIDDCTDIAREHGVGKWTADKWKWPVEDRSDRASCVKRIHAEAGSRMRVCAVEDCVCHELLKSNGVGG